MTIEDKLLLIKEGYTKADIEAMAGDPKQAPDPKPAPDPTPKKEDPVTLTWDQLTQLINSTANPKPEPKPEPKAEPKPDPKPTAMTPEQYALLLQAINRNNANIDVPPTNSETVENMLADRLKGAFTSANREEDKK